MCVCCADTFGHPYFFSYKSIINVRIRNGSNLAKGGQTSPFKCGTSNCVKKQRISKEVHTNQQTCYSDLGHFACIGNENHSKWDQNG